MALKAKITKEAFGKLSEDLQKEYKTDGDNGEHYFLDVEAAKDLPDMAKIKGALEKERTSNKENIKKLKKWETALLDYDDPDAVVEKLNKIEELELEVEGINKDGKKYTEEDVEKKLELRVKGKEKIWLKEKADLDAKINDLTELSTKRQKKIVGYSLESEIAKITSGKINPKALRDVQRAAKQDLVYNEDTQTFETSDGADIETWFSDELEESNWAPSSAGGGAGGGGGLNNQSEIKSFSDYFNNQQK